MTSITVPIIRLDDNQNPLPFYATELSAGMDLSAAILEPRVIKPFAREIIPTGIAIALPQGYEAQIRTRSGLAAKNGVAVLNSPGTIDADYRGEIKVVLINLGQEDFTVTPGLRVAQMVVAPFCKVSFQETSNLEETQRGQQGFGSTGLS
jgi:dUTP pyrophosphatase